MANDDAGSVVLLSEARVGRLAGLEALRDVLAAAIAVDDGKQTAALARQLRDVLRDVDELKRAQRKGSRVDELAQRRKAAQGGADAKGAVPAKRSRTKRGS